MPNQKLQICRVLRALTHNRDCQGKPGGGQISGVAEGRQKCGRVWVCVGRSGEMGGIGGGGMGVPPRIKCLISMPLVQA